MSPAMVRATVALCAVHVMVTAATKGQESAVCREAVITFHTGTLERLILQPESVLAHEEAFWAEEPPQRFTRQWSEGTGVAIDYEQWRERVRALTELTEAERRDHPLARMAQDITDGGEAFLARAVPHLCSYLPDESSLDIEVHFTAYVPPRAFVSSEVVINVSSTYWQGSVDNILNTLVHEIFHVGYSKSRPTRSEPRLEDEQLYGMIENLQNEGLATYVGYRAQEIFPAPGERDYPMLDDPAQVRRLRTLINGLFAQVGVASRENVERWAWSRGVTMRGYYVVGAHMGRTIESELGREALIDTIRRGPVSFVETYNALVADGDRVTLP